jgi:hypothetical protein
VVVVVVVVMHVCLKSEINEKLLIHASSEQTLD